MGKADPVKSDHRLPPATIVCALAFATAVVLFLFAPGWAWVPLTCFVAVSLAAPFLPALGFFFPVISHGSPDRRVVALTFDDGPVPQTTPLLLQMLERQAVPATFFVVGRLAEQHADLLARLIESGHEIGNHTHSHDVLLMLRRTRTIALEIDRCQEVLRTAGIQTRFFRPPVGIVNPRLGRLLRERDLVCITFSCRGGDRGNRKVAGLSARVLTKVRPGNIVLLHDGTSGEDFDPRHWLAEIEAIISGLKLRGLKMVKLSELTDLETRAVLVNEPSKPRDGA
jgi:peptidoglycan/xylan/chitin deacetylase (PgdA/CDA1 family)